MEVITQHGIRWQLARVWIGGDRALEAALKAQKHSPRLCPICSNAKRPLGKRMPMVERPVYFPRGGAS